MIRGGCIGIGFTQVSCCSSRRKRWRRRSIVGMQQQQQRLRRPAPCSCNFLFERRPRVISCVFDGKRLDSSHSNHQSTNQTKKKTPPCVCKDSTHNNKPLSALCSPTPNFWNLNRISVQATRQFSPESLQPPNAPPTSTAAAAAAAAAAHAAAAAAAAAWRRTVAAVW